MPGIGRRLEWDRLPRHVVPLDRQSSQARGLRFAVNLGASLAVDVADGVPLTLLDGGSSVGPKRAGFFGVGQVFDPNAYNSCLYAPSWTNTTNEASVCLVFHTNIAGSAGEVWELGGTDTDHFPFGSGAYADPFWSSRWMSNVAAPSGASFSDPVCLVFTVKNGSQKAYWNGRLWYANTATGGFTLPATLKYFKPRTGGIGFAAFAWDRFLDEREACEIGSGLLRFFEPEQIYVPFASGGATDYPVTATDALTLADSASQAFAATGVAAEALTLADSASNVASLGAANSAALTLADSATNVAALSATATDALTLADTLNATASGDYTATSSDALTLADSASNVAVLGATASDALTLADAASNVAAFIATITEAMTLADTSNGSTTGMFTATITESMFLADTLLAAGGSPASFWTQISTTQVAGWGQTDNTQSSGWTIIPTT